MNHTKERNVLFDYIRVFAMTCVIFYHFEIEFVSKGILNFTFSQFRNINLGGIGVFMFFMLSGNTISNKYKNSMKVREFYKKRFFRIFPLFWITYIMAFSVEKLIYKRTFMDVKPWKIILTLLGCDGYFPSLNPTYYLVGEWFTPIIICVYLLFPLIRYIMIFHSKFLVGIVFIDILVLANIYNPFQIVADGNIFMAITAFIFGARFGDIINCKVRLHCSVIPIWMGVIVFSKILPSAVLNMVVAGLFFYLFFCHTEKFKSNKIIEIIAKYSYGIYLTHHYVLRKVVMWYELLHRNIIICGLLFICITIIYTFLAYYIENVIKNVLSKVKK